MSDKKTTGRKKATQWEKNYKAVERAQKNALKRIKELENQGYKVSENVKAQVEKNISGKRWTKSQVEKYRKVTANVSRIKSYAERTLTYKAAGGVQKVFKKKASSYSSFKMANEIARDLKKGSKNLNRGSAKLMAMLFGQFGTAIGLKSSFPLLSRKFNDIAKVGDILKSVDEKELTKIVSGIVGSKYGETFVKSIYSVPILEESKKKLKEKQIESAKKTFGEHFEIDDDTVDLMFDFFDSDVWQKYRESKDSYYNEEEVSQLIKGVKKGEFTNDDLKKILVNLAGGSSLRKAVFTVKGV